MVQKYELKSDLADTVSYAKEQLKALSTISAQLDEGLSLLRPKENAHKMAKEPMAKGKHK